MKYIIFDLEATCWKGPPEPANEIIEIGAIAYDDAGKEISEFCEFARPKLNSTLSWFCKELTTITQKEIDESDSFPVVLQRFQDWINLDEPYLLCSWGHYDRQQLEKDCYLHGLNSDWAQSHVSLKHQYTDILDLKHHYGMTRALNLEKIAADGTHHRGIDDARNIAKIFLVHFGKWGAQH